MAEPAKRWLLPAAALLPALLPAQKGPGQGDLVKVELEKPAGMHYHLFIPRGADPRGAHPLVLALHGNGEKALARARNMSRVSTRALPLFVAAPQYQVTPRFEARPRLHEGWLQACRRIVEQVCARYPVDRSRVLLQGFSMGSNCASRLLWWWHREDPEGMPFRAFWMSSTCDPGWLRGPAAPRIPYLLFCGSRETAVKGVVNVVRQARLGYRWFFAQGFDVRYIEIPGMGHTVNRQCHERMRRHLASLPSHAGLLARDPRLPAAAAPLVRLCLAGEFGRALAGLEKLAGDRELALTGRARVRAFIRRVEGYLKKLARARPRRGGSPVAHYLRLERLAGEVEGRPALERAFAEGLRRAARAESELAAWRRFRAARREGGAKGEAAIRALARGKLAGTDYGRRAAAHLQAMSDRWGEGDR